MGACDGRTQGASLAALAGRPRTRQRACPARSGGPCSFCWSFLAGRDPLGRGEELVPAAELHAGTAEPLACGALELVDRRPALVDDGPGASSEQQPLEVVRRP